MKRAEHRYNPRVVAGAGSGFEALERFDCGPIDPLRSVLPVAVELEDGDGPQRADRIAWLRASGFLVDAADPARLRLLGTRDQFARAAAAPPDRLPELHELAAAAARAVENAFADRFEWACRGRTVALGSRPLVMGVLNVTPDSFSDGGRYAHPERAIERVFELSEAGADVIDVGAESTRPGAAPVSPDEELDRLVPVLEAVLPSLKIPVSIDTMKSEVAARCLELGAAIVNDVSGLERDPRIAEVAARHRAGLILNHMKGTPRTMQQQPRYDDPVAEICRALRERLDRAQRAGVGESQIVLDPGIGFGKRLEDNLDLLARIGELRSLGRPLLVGCSRKAFLGQITGRPVEERGAATLATTALLALRGVKLVRVHDVQETRDLLNVLSAIDGRLRLA